MNEDYESLMSIHKIILSESLKLLALVDDLIAGRCINDERKERLEHTRKMLGVFGDQGE